MSAFYALLKRDILLSLREGGTIGIALGFNLIVVSILPLGLGPDMNLLNQIAPGALWVTLLLSLLLSLDRIFLNDYEEGTLELMVHGPLPLEMVGVAKALAHWLTVGVPLSLMTPVMGLLMNLSPEQFGILTLAALIGTPALSFIGAIGAALTLGLKRGGLLLPLLILPFFIPTLIFGVSATTGFLFASGNFESSLALLAAITLSAIALAPFPIAWALRFNLS
ncbi:MAG: heme exporter protein B [Rhodomicrobium sp.]|nr:MAG: heme exporter protein B [Rhodomicrobium sp.]